MRLTLSMLIVFGLVGCASLADDPPDNATDIPSSSAAAEPVLRSPKALPSGMVLPPILDPDGPGSPYFRGEPVSLGDLVITYIGTSSSAQGLVAAFEVDGSLPDDVGALFFLPGGPSVPVTVEDGVVTSEVFTLDRNAGSSTLFAWQVAGQTVVWELGPISGQ